MTKHDMNQESQESERSEVENDLHKDNDDHDEHVVLRFGYAPCFLNNPLQERCGERQGQHHPNLRPFP